MRKIQGLRGELMCSLRRLWVPFPWRLTFSSKSPNIANHEKTKIAIFRVLHVEEGTARGKLIWPWRLTPECISTRNFQEIIFHFDKTTVIWNSCLSPPSSFFQVIQPPTLRRYVRHENNIKFWYLEVLHAQVVTIPQDAHSLTRVASFGKGFAKWFCLVIDFLTIIKYSLHMDEWSFNWGVIFSCTFCSQKFP